MERYKSVLYLIPFLILLAFILDADQDVKVSYTEILIGFLNVLVMGTLTYFIYKSNKRLTDITGKQVSLTLSTIYNPILYNLNVDINSLYNFSRFLKLHYSAGDKRGLLLGELKEIFQKFEEKKLLPEGTFNKIENMQGVTEEESKEIDSCIKNFIILSYYDFGNLDNINTHISALIKLNDNVEYRKILLEFTSDINYAIVLSGNLAKKIENYKTYSFREELDIGTNAAIIHDIVLDIIESLESAKEDLINQLN